jgi:hypothetical protein
MTVQCAVTPTSYPMKSMTVKSVLSLSVTVTSSYLYPHSENPLDLFL